MHNPMLQEFYGWWQFSVCTFAFFALFAIWWHLGKEKRDFGQIWLALSVLCWGVLGLVEVFYAKNLLAQMTSGNEPPLLQGLRSILSLCNSFFILLALPYFKYIPSRVKSLVTSNNWYFIAGIPFLFALLPMLSIIFTGESYKILSQLDLYYAFFTLVFLGFVLYESFAKRDLKLLAYLSVVCILITLIGQVLKLSGGSVNMLLVSAIFKTCLIMLFFALALSWVKDLIEEKPLLSQFLKLSLSKQKNEKGKFENWVFIQGIPNKNQCAIRLTKSPFDLLMLFAQKRQSDNPWLEIKPKSESRPSKVYDIQDYNQIKRLIEGLLDGIYGKGNWLKAKHFESLKSALFEGDESKSRRIKLKIPADNIQLLEQSLKVL